MVVGIVMIHWYFTAKRGRVQGWKGGKAESLHPLLFGRLCSIEAFARHAGLQPPEKNRLIDIASESHVKIPLHPNCSTTTLVETCLLG
jgi:hypothetical protein